jgi:hypothetical protein
VTIAKDIVVPDDTINISLHHAISNLINNIISNAESSIKGQSNVMKGRNNIFGFPAQGSQFSKIGKAILWHYLESTDSGHIISRGLAGIFNFYRKSRGLIVFNVGGYAADSHPGTLIQFHGIMEDDPLEVRKVGIDSRNGANKQHYSYVGFLIRRCVPKVPTVIGLMFFLMGSYCALAGIWNFIGPMRVMVSIGYCLLGFGLMWVGLHHLVFGFEGVWYGKYPVLMR